MAEPLPGRAVPGRAAAMPRWYDLAFRGVARGPVTRRIRTVNSSDWAVRARPPDGCRTCRLTWRAMHGISRTQLENRSLQHVECPVQERAALLTRSAYDEVLRVHPALVGKLLPGLIRVLILRLRRANVKLVDRQED